MSKGPSKTTPKTSTGGGSAAFAAATTTSAAMTAEEAASLIIAPYITEKTFNQIEKENKLTFIVADKATKKKIIEAIALLYEAEADEVNTARTIQGKKAFVKFKAAAGARELATRLGLV